MFSNLSVWTLSRKNDNFSMKDLHYPVIDSHVHLDLLDRHHPRQCQWLQEKGCSVISWSYFDNIDSVPDFKKQLESKAHCIHRYAKDGLECRYLAGVHPRSIPPELKPEQIESVLTPYIGDPLCLGIGEIGLETGDAREREVLIAQLELGRQIISRGKVVGVHTPRSNKASITRTTLKVLKGYPDLAPSLVVDHCTVDTISEVLEADFWAGVTLSPVKTGWAELIQIVKSCAERVNRIMCNTDSGTSFFEDVVRHRGNEDLSESIREKIFYENAAIFFHLN